MNYNTKYVVILITCFVVITPIVLYLSNNTNPSDIESEITSLRTENKEVIMFYDTFDNVSIVPNHFNFYNATTGEDYGGKWRIGLDSQHSGQIHRLDVYYFAWEPFGITYKCFDSTTNVTKIYSDGNILDNMKYYC